MDSHIKPQPFNRLGQKLVSLIAATNVVGLNESGIKVGYLVNQFLVIKFYLNQVVRLSKN